MNRYLELVVLVFIFTFGAWSGSEFAMAQPVSCGDAPSATISERIEDCSRFPRTHHEDWVLVTRRPGVTEVWKDLKTGLLWSEALEEPVSFRDAWMFCAKTARFPTVHFRVPGLTEWNTALGNNLTEILRKPQGSFWTNDEDLNSRFYTIDVKSGELGAQYPHYPAAVRCVGQENDEVIGKGTDGVIGYYDRKQCESMLERWPVTSKVFDSLLSMSAWDAKFQCSSGKKATRLDSLESLKVEKVCDPFYEGVYWFPTMILRARYHCEY